MKSGDSEIQSQFSSASDNSVVWWISEGYCFIPYGCVHEGIPLGSCRRIRPPGMRWSRARSRETGVRRLREDAAPVRTPV